MKMFFLIGLWYVRFLPALRLAGIINLFDAVVLSQWKWLFWEELMLYFWASHKNILDKVQPELTFFPLATLSAEALCWRIADMLEHFSISLLCNVMLLRECTQMHPSPVWHTEKCCEAEQSQHCKTLPSVVFFFSPIWYSIKLFHASLFVLDSWVILFYAYYAVDTFGSVTQKNFSLKPSLALMKAERTVPFLFFIMTNKQKKSLA